MDTAQKRLIVAEMINMIRCKETVRVEELFAQHEFLRTASPQATCLLDVEILSVSGMEQFCVSLWQRGILHPSIHEDTKKRSAWSVAVSGRRKKAFAWLLANTELTEGVVKYVIKVAFAQPSYDWAAEILLTNSAFVSPDVRGVIWRVLSDAGRMDVMDKWGAVIGFAGNAETPPRLTDVFWNALLADFARRNPDIFGDYGLVFDVNKQTLGLALKAEIGDLVLGGNKSPYTSAKASVSVQPSESWEVFIEQANLALAQNEANG